MQKSKSIICFIVYEETSPKSGLFALTSRFVCVSVRQCFSFWFKQNLNNEKGYNIET